MTGESIRPFRGAVAFPPMVESARSRCPNELSRAVRSLRQNLGEGASMAGGFRINKQAIRDMTREIEKEFAKNPVRIPLEMDSSGIATPPTTVNHYSGPVVTVHGDHAQIAWGNDTVTQNQNKVEDIAPGFEGLGRVLRIG